MKKLFIVILSILLLAFTACSNSETASDTVSDGSTNSVQSSDKNEVSKSEEVDTDIEKIYLNLSDNAYEVDVNSESIDKIEASKTINKPLVKDLNIDEAGTISVIYKGKDEEKVIGKAYIGDFDIYIQNNENEYGAVLKFYSFSSDNDYAENRFDAVPSIFKNNE